MTELIRVGSPKGFPKKPMIDWRRGTLDQAAAAYPEADIYFYNQSPRGQIILIDTHQPTQDDDQPQTGSDQADPNAAPQDQPEN